MRARALSVTHTRTRAGAAALLVSICLAWLVFAAEKLAPALPAELSDKDFWNLIVEMSEPDGFFEDENFVSNETGYQRVMPRLQDAVKPGGVYLGVGPEQNFTYVAALRPALAFIVDVRRQNLVEHLVYKALFELSADRADFLSRLFSRPRPANLHPKSGIEALFQAFRAAPSDRQLFDQTLAQVGDVLTRRHRFELRAGDGTALRKILNAFYEGGPDLRYVFRNTPELHPTYAQLMTAADERGTYWSFLGSDDRFEYVRLMQQRNLIVPVVGDVAGPRALRAVGHYVRARGGTIDVFYVSNVESYLFRAATSKAFYENVLTLPLHENGVFIRTFFGATARECAAQRPTIRTPVLGSMTAVLTAYRNGTLTSQCDLVAASR